VLVDSGEQAFGVMRARFDASDGVSFRSLPDA
jgi:hypothetical protein